MTRPAVLLCLAVPLLLTAQPAVPSPGEELLRPPAPGRFKTLFQPFRTEQAALSPDGRYVAYSLREGDAVSVAVVEIDHPEKMTAHVKVVDDESATPMMADRQRERTPARINWLRWVSPTRVAVETNQVYVTAVGDSHEWVSRPGTVFAFDADGGNARKLADASDVFETILTPAGPGGGNRFSTRRDNRFKYNPADPQDTTAAAADSRFNPTPDGSTAATGSLTGSAPEAEAPATPVSAGSYTLPRSLRVFDLDPARAGAVTLVASGTVRDDGNRMLGFYSLDAGTGKLTSLADTMVSANETPRIDRQGRVRLTLPSTTLRPFPLPYAYLGARGQGRPQPLEATAKLPGLSVSPDNYFGERTIPVGFDENPDILYYASNVGRDTFGLYSVNLATGQRGGLAMENPAYDLIGPPGAGFPDLDTLVFDRFTHKLAGVRCTTAFRTTAWVRPELQELQARLEKMFPGRSVDITDWDEAGRRYLVATEGPADPGAFYLFDRGNNKLMEFVRKAPWIDANQTHLTLPFSFTQADGSRLSGLVTAPQQPRLKPIPMVILCPDVPWQRVRPDFQPEVQALADMGFVVVQFNGRGAWGLGLKQRQAIAAGYDLAQVEDITATVDNLLKIFAVNPRRIALLGRGHGGFIALRALQEHPDRFRCAIALDAPVNLADWLAEQKWSDDDVAPHLTRAWLGDAARLKAAPLTSAPEKITKPVLLLNYPGIETEPRRPGYVAAHQLAGRIGNAEFDSLHIDYLRGLPAARAEVFDRIETFLNLHVYDFKVKLDDLQIIK